MVFLFDGSGARYELNSGFITGFSDEQLVRCGSCLETKKKVTSRSPKAKEKKKKLTTTARGRRCRRYGEFS